jgi:adenylate cyclase class 2
LPEEIEKKYRLTPEQRAMVLRQLERVGATLKGNQFEENTLYRGGSLDPGRSALRLRRVGETAVLTYKERIPTASAIKHQREFETEVSNPETLDGIFRALGFAPILVYEKRRMTWEFDEAEIVLDELPFGLFMEIEGRSVSQIEAIEQALAVQDFAAEHETYPTLTLKHGQRCGEVIASRFAKK